MHCACVILNDYGGCQSNLKPKTRQGSGIGLGVAQGSGKGTIDDRMTLCSIDAVKMQIQTVSTHISTRTMRK